MVLYIYARESGVSYSFARRKGTPVTSALEPTANLNEVRLLLTRLQNEVSFTEENGGTALSIMESMLAAESEEELFDRQEAGAVSSKDFVLRPFRLLPENIQWKNSNKAYIEQGGFPFYALITVTDMETGDRVVIDSGSPSVISILSKLVEFDDPSRAVRSFEPHRERGGRPLQFVEKPVSSGYSVILLKPVVTGEETTTKTRAKRV